MQHRTLPTLSVHNINNNNNPTTLIGYNSHQQQQANQRLHPIQQQQNILAPVHASLHDNVYTTCDMSGNICSTTAVPPGTTLTSVNSGIHYVIEPNHQQQEQQQIVVLQQQQLLSQQQGQSKYSRMHSLISEVDVEEETSLGAILSHSTSTENASEVDAMPESRQQQQNLENEVASNGAYLLLSHQENFNNSGRDSQTNPTLEYSNYIGEQILEENNRDLHEEEVEELGQQAEIFEKKPNILGNERGRKRSLSNNNNNKNTRQSLPKLRREIKNLKVENLDEINNASKGKKYIRYSKNN